MCGRKYDSAEAESERKYLVSRANLNPKIRKAIEEIRRLFTPNFDIRPTQKHYVVANKEGEPIAKEMKWGFKPSWSNMLLFNSRRDKIEGKAWGKAFRERRCIVPVAGFYEWTGEKKARQPHAISFANHAPMFLAGLWLEHEDEQCYSVITTEASPFMAPLHDREPVIISSDDVEEYLFSKDAPVHLLKQAPDGALAEFECASPKYDCPPKPATREMFPGSSESRAKRP